MTQPQSEAFSLVFDDLPRQGPGSDPCTRALLRRIRPWLPEKIDAADMGCGNGRSAMVIAEVCGGPVTAVDLHQPYLTALMAQAERRGLSDRLIARNTDMLDSGLKKQSLDLLWSEGAAFAVGFEQALSVWYHLLKPGALLVVSECSWLTANPARPVAAFWNDAYPEMQTVGGNVSLAEGLGYGFIHAEVLPGEAWEDEYYRPLEQRIATLAERAADIPHLKAVMAGVKAEIAMFRQHHDHYGYVFYVLRRM